MTRKERAQWMAMGRAWEGPKSDETESGLCDTALRIGAFQAKRKLDCFWLAVTEGTSALHLAPKGQARGARAMLAYLGALGALD